MRAIVITSTLYMIPDDDAVKLDRLLEKADNAKGDDAMYAAQKIYNDFLNNIKLHRSPVVEIYNGYNFL